MGALMNAYLTYKLLKKANKLVKMYKQVKSKRKSRKRKGDPKKSYGGSW